MATYRLQDLVGKRVRAAKPVNVYRSPDKTLPVLRTYPTGAEIGTVFSWVTRSDGTYLSFDDLWGQMYYLPYTDGILDSVTLGIQGVKSEQEIQQQQQEEAMDWTDKAKDYVTWLLLGLGGFILIRDQLKK